MHRPLSKDYHARKFKEAFKNMHAPIETKIFSYKKTLFMTQTKKKKLWKHLNWKMGK